MFYPYRRTTFSGLRLSRSIVLASHCLGCEQFVEPSNLYDLQCHRSRGFNNYMCSDCITNIWVCGEENNPALCPYCFEDAGFLTIQSVTQYNIDRQFLLQDHGIESFRLRSDVKDTKIGVDHEEAVYILLQVYNHVLDHVGGDHDMGACTVCVEQCNCFEDVLPHASSNPFLSFMIEVGINMFSERQRSSVTPAEWETRLLSLLKIMLLVRMGQKSGVTAHFARASYATETLEQQEAFVDGVIVGDSELMAIKDNWEMLIELFVDVLCWRDKQRFETV